MKATVKRPNKSSIFADENIRDVDVMTNANRLNDHKYTLMGTMISTL